ncbi:MAG: hypothetical protein H0T71_09980 [Acidobacteria bacterium]|nr:hypothetical protein [Acidobacteriota bacterium]
MVTPRLILSAFIIAQVCDAVFTYAAVQAYGVAAEGNVLLATWMALVGPEPALIGAKLMAAGCGVLLYCLGVHRVLLGLTIFYGVAAIGPWLMVLRQL